MTNSLRVLIVEDSPEDALLILQELSDGGFKLISQRVANAVETEAALNEQKWDLIISDFSIPGFDGRAVLALIQQKGLDIPFIMVSGVMGEMLAVETLKSGVHNYVMKDQLGRLAPVVRQELRAAQQRVVRNQAESTAAYIASMVESCDHAIIGTTLDGTVVSWNTGAKLLFGFHPAEIVGHSGAVLVPSYLPDNLSEILNKIGTGGSVESRDTAWLRKDGRPVHVLLAVSPIKDGMGRIVGASIVAHDITRRMLEENERLALIQELTATLAHMAKAKR